MLDVLRDALDIGSASRGCQDGRCGACRVLLDGAVVNACLLRWREVRDGATLASYEDLSRDPAAMRVVEAFLAERPTRCRSCVGALAVTAVSLARAKKSGDNAAVNEAIGEATCMCTGRGSWRRALAVV